MMDVNDLSSAGGIPGTELVRPSKAQLWEVLQGILRTVAFATGGCAYLALIALMAAHHEVPRWDLYAGPIVLFIAVIGTLVWALPYRARAGLLVGALLFCSVAVDLASGQPQAQLLYTFSCLMGGVLLGPEVATGAAVLGTAAVLARSGGIWTNEPTLWSLGTLWVTLLLVWTALGGLFQAVRRAQADEAQAWVHVGEARTRRGELVRAQKALGEMYDLLERANHELAIARAQAEEARQIKAQFAANVSHELRTPLNLIMGFSDLMFRSPEAYGDMRWTPELRADIREIHRASRHLLGMIDDILDLSRIEAQRMPLRLEVTDPGELIRETVATSGGLLRGKPIVLAAKLPEVLPQVLVDRTRIRQVLLNLLNNAIRFTDQGEIAIAANVVDGELTISVTDTGVGIPADELQAIFEEFRQAKGPVTAGRGGAGLGLAICKQFVRLHGGHIEAESQVGQGSTFRFSLPLPEGHPSAPGLFYYVPEGWSPPVPENPLGKTAIVLGRDEAANATLARAITGYRTLPMSTLDGLAARVEAEHPAGIVLVSDPEAREPFALDEVWHAAGRKDLPIVRCQIPRKEAVPPDLGADAYLVKPVQLETLVGALQKLCPQPQNILLVDDDPGFVALVQRMLRTQFGSARLRGAYSGREALEALAQEEFDLVVLDLIMPDVNGLQVIATMRQEPRLATIPVLVTTGSGYGEEMTDVSRSHLELLRAGTPGQGDLGRYVTALLDAVPPDYSRPVLAEGRQATAVERPAS